MRFHVFKGCAKNIQYAHYQQNNAACDLKAVKVYSKQIEYPNPKEQENKKEHACNKNRPVDIPFDFLYGHALCQADEYWKIPYWVHYDKQRYKSFNYAFHFSSNCKIY